jgi:hypothetical protein
VNKRDLVSSGGGNGFEFLVATTNMCNLPFFFWKVLFSIMNRRLFVFWVV